MNIEPRTQDNKQLSGRARRSVRGAPAEASRRILWATATKNRRKPAPGAVARRRRRETANRHNDRSNGDWGDPWWDGGR